MHKGAALWEPDQPVHRPVLLQQFIHELLRSPNGFFLLKISVIEPTVRVFVAEMFVDCGIDDEGFGDELGPIGEN